MTKHSNYLPSTSTKKITSTMDWISLTIKTETTLKAWETDMMLKSVRDKESYHSVKGKNGYDTAYRFQCGAEIMVSQKRTDMGIHIIFSGEALRNIQEAYDLDGFDIVNWYHSEYTNYSRIDLALDAFNFNAKAEHFDNLVTQNKCSNKRAKKLFIKNHSGDGDTLYIGSMKKRKRLLRIYDKGLQTGEHDDWIRFEIQMSGGYGNIAYDHLSDKMEQKTSAIQEVIASWANFNGDSLWDEIFQCENVSLKSPISSDTATEKWLLETVSKSLAKASLDKPEIVSKFIDKYLAHRKNLEDERAWD